MTLLLMGCGEDPIAPTYKCQLVVVLDKTGSVSYANRLPDVQQKLASEFARTYGSAEKNIQTSLFEITGDTKVFPEFNRFEKGRPVDDGSRGSQEAVQHWDTQKRTWLSDRVKDIVARINIPCTSKSTDIFSVFSGIEDVQKNGGAWDSVDVVIFSDMVNTGRRINMNREIDMANAKVKGGAICNDLIKTGQLSGTGKDNLYLTIYIPDDVKKTAELKQFWEGFFEQWGLKRDHYRIEQNWSTVTQGMAGM